MTAWPVFHRSALAVFGLSLTMLAACAEREVILPGIREDIRSAALVEDEADAVQRNETRDIRLAAATTNADWPQSFGTPAFRTAHPALRGAPQLIWSVNIGEGDSRRQRISADPVVGGGRIYTLDANAQVAAVSTGGGLLWSTDLTPARGNAGDATGGGLAYDDGTLYVTLGFGDLVALDATSGGVRWRQQLGATGGGAPIVADGLIYFVAGDDTGWVVNADTGRVEWQVDATPSVANVLGGPAPALTDKLAVFAFGSGDVLATFKRGGLRRWDASVAGQRLGSATARIGDITGAPVVVGDRIFVGSHSGRMVALDAESGDRLWTAREGALGPVWPAGDSVFAVTDTNRLARIDASDGTTVWQVDLPGFVKDRPRRRAEIVAHYGPIVAGGRVIVASNDGFLRSFQPQSGALVGSVEVPGGASSAPAIAGGTLYVVSTNGQLHAFR